MFARFLRAISVVTALCAVLAYSLYADERQLSRYAELTILHTNDLHGHLWPHEHRGNMDIGGAARISTLVNRIRMENRGPVIVMDAGDFFTRGPLALIYQGESDFAFINTVPYDIITLGNNELKGDEGMAGQQVMFDRISQAEMPIVCANLVRKDCGELIVPEYVIIKRQGIRYGIFGLIASSINSYPQAEGLRADDPVETARKLVPRLKEESDVIIALTHIGYHQDLILAAEAPEIDVIIGGHSSTWLHQPELVKASDIQHAFWVGGPVVAQAGDRGRVVGRLDLTFRLHEDNNYRVMSYSGSLLPVNASTPDCEKVESALEPYVRPFNEVIGESARAMSGSQAANWVANVYGWAGGNCVGVGARARSLRTSVQNSLAAGPITPLYLRRMYPFDDELVAGGVSGQIVLNLIADARLLVTASAEKVHPDDTYVICMEKNVWEDFLVGLEYKPVGMTVHEALVEYVSGQETIAPVQ